MNNEKQVVEPISFIQPMPDYRLYQSNCVEFWMPINPLYVPNLNNRYWVSTFGRVYDSFAYYGKGKYLEGSFDSKKYLKVTLMDLSGNKITRKIHRLVMMTFYYFPGCEDYEVNHKDGNHLNNNVYNLEWTTGAENRKHAILTGLEPTIFGAPIAILSDEQVWKIRELVLQNKYSYNQIIDILKLRDIPGISRHTIGKIVQDKAKIYQVYPYFG